LKKGSGKTASTSRALHVRSGKAAASPSVNAVFLVGFMGAGKSSVGRALGQHLNWMFEDLDDRIVARERRTVAEIFRNSGESEFRRAERAALQQILEELRGGVAKIIALGGGAFVQEENAALLQASGVPAVFLDAPVEELWQRCSAQARETGAQRPLLQSQEQFRKLYAARRRSYSRAGVEVPTGGRPVEAIAAEIARTLRLKRIASRSETVRIEEGEAE
jgi:shikimate kinase